jgi:hypothetical protein
MNPAENVTVVQGPNFRADPGRHAGRLKESPHGPVQQDDFVRDQAFETFGVHIRAHDNGFRRPAQGTAFPASGRDDEKPASGI